MRQQLIIGFLGRLPINIFGKMFPHKLLGSRIFRNTPAIGFAVFILHVNKIADYHIAPALQAADDGIKALVSSLAEIAEGFQFFGDNRRVIVNQLIEQLITVSRKTVVVACVEVIAVAPVVCENGKPFGTDIAGFFLEKFAIRTACFTDNGSFPFPCAPDAAVTVIPAIRRNVLLNRKALNGVGKERQKAECMNCVNQVSFASDDKIRKHVYPPVLRVDSGFKAACRLLRYGIIGQLLHSKAAQHL